jgi:nucleotide-binding universal stress UspA family protein
MVAVLAYRQGNEGGWAMFKNILVPVDGGDLSATAMARACAFAREAGARVVFYHAIPIYLPAALSVDALFDNGSAYEVFRTAVEQRAQVLLLEAARLAREAGVEHDTVSSECASPYEGIIAAAEQAGCDLIFMASHGRRGAGAFLLGSETQKVLTHCKIPVLIYR